MGQIVELEGAAQALEAGSKFSLTADTSTLVSGARQRKALLIFNNEETETIFVRFAADGGSASGGIPVKAGTGLVIKAYHGPVCAYSTNGATEVFKAEF